MGSGVSEQQRADDALPPGGVFTGRLDVRQGRRPLVIGVAGGSGAGKTTVAHAIVAAVGVERVAQLSEDSYYREFAHLPEAERARINWDHPDAIESDLLRAHLEALLRGEPVAR